MKPLASSTNLTKTTVGGDADDGKGGTTQQQQMAKKPMTKEVPATKDEDPVALKAKGNSLFQAGKYNDAMLLYNKAYDTLLLHSNNRSSTAAPTPDVQYQQAVLLSNRSNCLFELGQYQDSIVLARQCLELLDNNLKTISSDAHQKQQQQHDNLQRKNLLRIARAGIYGGSSSSSSSTNNNSVELEDFYYKTNVVEPLQFLATCGDAAYEKRAIKLLDQTKIRRQMQNNKETNKESSSAAPPPLPSIFRASLQGSSIREYYNYGHDIVGSALGPGDPAEEDSYEPSCSAVELAKLPESHLSQLSILFGGVGDARHVFATLCDAHKQWTNLDDDPTKQEKFKLHMTLNDINPTVLARFVLMVAGLIRLGKLAPNDRHEAAIARQDPQQQNIGTAFHAATMLEYTFFSYTMPPSVYDYQMKLIDDLMKEDFQSLKGVLMIADDDTWSKIKDIMKYWRNAKEGEDYFPTTAIAMTEHYRAERDPDEESIYRRGTEAHAKIEAARNAKAEQNQLAAKQMQEEMLGQLETKMSIDDFPDFMVETVRMKMPSATDDQVIKFLKKMMRQTAEELDADDLAGMQDGSISNGRDLDSIFIKAVNAILPPRGCNEKLCDDIHKGWARQKGVPVKKSTEKARTHIMEHWKVNRTMYDPSWNNFKKGSSDTNYFNPVADIGKDFLLARDGVLLSFKGGPPDDMELDSMNFFQCCTLFFWNVAHALTNLLAAGSLCLELNSGPITSCCREKIQEGACKFHRIFMSNIPDYIGFLSVLTEVAPLLHRPSKFVPTLMQCNVLYNTGIWSSYSHYIYSATGIANFNDALKILGFRHLTMDSVWAQQNQWTWSEESNPQATREELTMWLHRVLLFALLPPGREARARFNEQCTTNVATFMRVCAFCVEELRYPPHWVGGVLDDIVNACSTGTLKTKADIPASSPIVYSGKSTLRKVDLRPFRVEIFTQLKIWSLRYRQSLVPLAALPSLKTGQCKKYRLVLARDNDDNDEDEDDDYYDDKRPYLSIADDRYSAFAMGGNPHSMVLGFVLSESEYESYPETPFDSLGAMFGIALPSSNSDNGRIRSDALTKGDAAPQIFSCMTFNCNLTDQKHSIEFYMDEDDYNKYGNRYIIPIRTDSWNRLINDDQMRLNKAVLVDEG